MSQNDCRDVFEMLSEYIDGDLPTDTCEEIEKHIADCAPCVQFVESLRKSVSVYRDYRPAENPLPLSSDARERLAQAYRDMVARRHGNAVRESAR
jgi:anti-sigma factor RsiW